MILYAMKNIQWLTSVKIIDQRWYSSKKITHTKGVGYFFKGAEEKGLIIYQ
jgi:hypothetical protein